MICQIRPLIKLLFVGQELISYHLATYLVPVFLVLRLKLLHDLLKAKDPSFQIGPG